MRQNTRYQARTHALAALLPLVVLAAACGGTAHRTGSDTTPPGPETGTVKTAPSATTAAEDSTAVRTDAETIAYACGTPPQICLVESDGTRPRRLTDSGNNEGPEWWPDGTALTYSRYVDGTFQIFALALGADQPAAMTHGGGNKLFADMSPDGTEFVVADDRDGDFDLYRLDTSGRMRKLTNGAGDEIDPEWTADGCCITFTRSSGGRFPDMYVTRRNGKGTFKIGPGLTPAWSPDGKTLAAALPTGLILIPEKGRVKRLTNHPYDVEPTWSPDGTRLAFRRGQTGRSAEIWVVNVDGTGLRQITHGAGDDVTPAWAP